ncbi:MAG TPA: SURF1 family protein [Caulobacteraceae bacterium]
MADARVRGRFPALLTILAAAAFVVLCGLGAWQVQRLRWKEDLIARAAAAQAAPPAPLAEVLRAADPEFRRVRLDCPGLATAPFVELHTIEQGGAGVRLISACRPVGLVVTVLVDRGFVAETISARPPEAASAAVTSLTGVLRTPAEANSFTPPTSGRLFFSRDHGAMARALGVTGPVDARVVFAETSTNPEWLALRPSAPPPAFRNNHLGYAITWFGLAAALLGVYLSMLRQRRRR